jgi:ABC-type multidrug transport system permease subunit
MNSLLYGFKSIASKEFLHIRRDPTTLTIALLIPVVQLILFGFALDFDIRHISTVVVDMSRSARSREFVEHLENTEYLDVVGYVATPDLAEQAVRRNDAYVALIIPADFQRQFDAGKSPMVRVLLDGSNSQVAMPVRNAFQQQPTANANGPVDVRVNILYNPDMRTQVFTIPALVCVLMQLIAVSLTSFSLVREREQGTLEQLMVSPVGALGLMLGKIAPYSVLAMAELVAVLFMGWLVFDVPVVGSLALLLVLAVPFVLAALAMGLFISTIAKNQAQALQMTMLTTMPSILLSGYITPRETLPLPLYLLSDVFPVTHFIQISRGIVVRGAGFMDVLPSVVWLICLATALMAAATARFRKNMA